MVWEIPYIFIAGTKAKANEVNGNFTSIKQFVDQLESNQATNELNISSLESNKADINGSQYEVFQVANAENNKDAVNLETLKDQTVNTLDTIRGFIASKSNSTTISCTAGDCWDSTYVQMISSPTALSLQDTTLADNSTYYIYVCYDKETSTCKLAFSTNSSTPTLPAGYDYFRRVGSFTTNSSGNIDTVTPYTGGGIWVTKTYRDGTSWYRLWSDGWKEQGGANISLTLGTNTITFLTPFSDVNYTIFKNAQDSGGGNTYARVQSFYNKTSSTVQTWADFNQIIDWYACGY